MFLSIESATCPMNAGSVGIFDGPAPDIDEVRTFVAGRIAGVPRCRQRIRVAAWNLARPIWIDDEHFDLGDHVRRASLPAGEPLALEHFVEELMIHPLDRSRALWEMWMLTGLPEGRWAVVSKVHHCMLDGIAGTDLLSVMMDGSPVPAVPAPDTWVPEPAPGYIAVARFVAEAMCRSAASRLRRVARACTHPAASARGIRDLAAGARALWLQPSRRNSPLTGPVGPDRRWAHTQVALDDLASARQACGGTVNDVVLAAVAHGFRALLISRGQEVADRDVMALVPVSTRTPDARGKLDNRVAVTHALLPVGIEDPMATVAAVHTHLVEVKASHETAASTVLLHSGDMVPHAVAAAIARGVVRAQQNLETIATNVPGPRTPLHLCGRRMVAAHPFAPIAGRIQVAVAIWSYCGTLYLGITGDRTGAGDIDRLVTGMERAFERLAARKVATP